MHATIEELRAMGGLAETRALVHRPRSLDELRSLFARSSRGAIGAKLTLVGGRHSFGDHFLPVVDGEAIDTTALGGDVTRLERDDDGGLWVRAPGGTTFEALAAAVPGYLSSHPPTSDLITLAGALSACTHDSVGYFAEHIRRFSVLTVDGRVHDCSPDATGIARELFCTVPGSFGALGVVLDMELRLFPAPPDRVTEVVVAHRGTYADGAGLARLEESFTRGPSWGAGLYIYGLRGATVLFEARIRNKAHVRRLPRLPLTDEATTRNIYLQAIANRAPLLAHRLAPYVLRDGRRFRATIYGHAFFQRSYARSYAALTAPSFGARALSLAGVEPRLPVVHQTFAIAPHRTRAFVDLYFDMLERQPKLVARLEQQDLVRLPPCAWPLHGAFGMEEGACLFTSSMSVPRSSAIEAEARLFFKNVADQAFQRLEVKTLLLKQAHVPAELLRAMHADALAHLARVKREVDPNGVLSSRFLERLLCRAPSSGKGPVPP